MTIKNEKRQVKTNESHTHKNNEIGIVRKDQAFEKGSGIEVRAIRLFARKHILTIRVFAVYVMHIRHLQYLKGSIFPKP